MKSEIKKILYATDLTKNSAYAYQFAADLAEKYNADVWILHVLEKIPESAMAIVRDNLSEKQLEELSNLHDNRVKRIKERLDVFCDKIQKDDPRCELRVVDVDVHEGYPAHEILVKAQETGCDLIVMGTHGQGILSHAFLGSVSEKVLRRSKIPILIIPLPEENSEITEYDI